MSLSTQKSSSGDEQRGGTWGCACVRAFSIPSLPREKNAAITPLAREGGGDGGIAAQRAGRGKRTQLTWPITANEVRSKQRGR